MMLEDSSILESFLEQLFKMTWFSILVPLFISTFHLSLYISFVLFGVYNLHLLLMLSFELGTSFSFSLQIQSHLLNVRMGLTCVYHESCSFVNYVSFSKSMNEANSKTFLVWAHSWYFTRLLHSSGNQMEQGIVIWLTQHWLVL